MDIITWAVGKTGKTGRLIRDSLHIRSQQSYRGGRINKLIRWGTTEAYDAYDVLNSSEAVQNSSNKMRTLKLLKQAGVSIPRCTSNKGKAERFLRNHPTKKMVGRTTHHQGGSNFAIANNDWDISQDGISTHWLELIPIHREYRVHVFRGEVIGVSRKTDEGVEERIVNRYTRNHANGWRFIRCDLDRVHPRLKEIGKEAVEIVGLDFGAVDVILSDGSETTSDGRRKYYVLEINSAPAMEPDSTVYTRYIEGMKEWLRE